MSSTYGSSPNGKGDTLQSRSASQSADQPQKVNLGFGSFDLPAEDSTNTAAPPRQGSTSSSSVEVKSTSSKREGEEVPDEPKPGTKKPRTETPPSEPEKPAADKDVDEGKRAEERKKDEEQKKDKEKADEKEKKEGKEEKEQKEEKEDKPKGVDGEKRAAWALAFSSGASGGKWNEGSSLPFASASPFSSAQPIFSPFPFPSTSASAGPMFAPFSLPASSSSSSGPAPLFGVNVAQPKFSSKEESFVEEEGGEAASAPEAPSVIHGVVQGSGEEEEEQLLQLRVRLFALERGSGAWQERGLCQLRLNVRHNDSSRSRIIARLLPAYRLVLNAAIWNGLPVRLQERQVVFTAPDPTTSTLQTFLVRTTRRDEAVELHRLIEKYRALAPPLPGSSLKPKEEAPATEKAAKTDEKAAGDAGSGTAHPAGSKEKPTKSNTKDPKE